MIKDQTRCEVVVGQNGVVWVKGKPEMERVVQKVVKTIEEEAHTSGLTDRIRDMLLELLGEKTEKPDTEKPDTEKPDTEKPDTEKPDTEKPDTEKPDSEKPDSPQPDTKDEEDEYEEKLIQ
jgi:RNA-binding protein Rrp4 and related proteins (contain S1 domain and KH domain)